MTSRGLRFWGAVGTVVYGALFLGSRSEGAALYRAGDVVQEFTLIDRSTRQPVNLSDLAGKIVFLEWFAWWCPFCQAAAPQVETGIVQWYATRGGNPAGIPVQHVAVNLQPNQETQTQNFLNRAGFGFVLEDFQRAVANRFQSGGQPIFAIINGVTNSPSHQPWELLLHQDGYGQRDFSASLERFRQAIDAVQGAPMPEPPRIHTQPESVEREEGEPFRLEVGVSGAPPWSFQWWKDGQFVPGGTNAVHEVEQSRSSDAGVYQVTVSNLAGTVESNQVSVRIRSRELRMPRLLVVGRDAEGKLRFSLIDVVDNDWVLQVSVDLINWSTLTGFNVGAPGQELAVELAGSGGFFRLARKP